MVRTCGGGDGDVDGVVGVGGVGGAGAGGEQSGPASGDVGM